MDLSIIILNFNTKEITEKCVSSVFRYKPGVTFEVIVVDNGSSDGSDIFLEKLSKRKNREFILIKNKDNVGFSRGNNIGIKKASGEYILLLNSDTEVSLGAIDNLYNFAKERLDVGVVGARLLNSDGSVQPSVFKFPTLMRTIIHYWFGKKVLDKYAPAGENATLVEALVGACFLITPIALKKVGLLNEAYFMYFEDLEYCRRVRRIGLMIYYLPSARVFHLHGQSGKNLVGLDDQWRRLIPSSKIYHGVIGYYLISFVIRVSQLCSKILKR